MEIIITAAEAILAYVASHILAPSALALLDELYRFLRGLIQGFARGGVLIGAR